VAAVHDVLERAEGEQLGVPGSALFVRGLAGGFVRRAERALAAGVSLAEDS
jgi:hypothetical protein